MQRPKVNSVIWDFFEHKTTPDFSYRVENSREHGTDYFRLRYIKNGKDKTKLFYGETAWMDITRFIHDLGDWSFSVDKVVEDWISLYREAVEMSLDTKELQESKGDC